MGASVSPASLYDSHGGITLLTASREHWRFLERCFADSAYAGKRVVAAAAIAVTAVRAEPGQTGFTIQPRRWIAERSSAPARRCRRLARDHEAILASALGVFALASAMLLVRQLAREL